MCKWVEGGYRRAKCIGVDGIPVYPKSQFKGPPVSGVQVDRGGYSGMQVGRGRIQGWIIGFASE